MIDWPQNLVNDLARRRAVIVIGSGVSKHSLGSGHVRPPTWKAFLLEAMKACPEKGDLKPVEDAINTGDFLHACEWLKSRFDEAWDAHLRGVFSTPAFAPADIHEQILKLDSRIVFSLNFDDIYERHANTVHRGSYITKSYYDPDVAEFLRGNGRYIIKVHGTLNVPKSLIFTQKDYAEARTKNLTFYQAFDAALLTHTFIFIGSGYNDPDINLLLENQNFSYPASTPHYFLSGSNYSNDIKKSLRQNRNLKVIDYDPVDDHHSGLVEELKTLNDKVDSERYDLSKSTSW